MYFAQRSQPPAENKLLNGVLLACWNSPQARRSENAQILGMIRTARKSSGRSNLANVPVEESTSLRRQIDRLRTARAFCFQKCRHPARGCYGDADRPRKPALSRACSAATWVRVPRYRSLHTPRGQSSKLQHMALKRLAPVSGGTTSVAQWPTTDPLNQSSTRSPIPK
ncbi:MAG: hypothetical protein CM15mP74_32250 [Halieaceae bacterium]|nr:MAG: hypothetical protein CM15mP74_32250 [Halieaceae bacterium]